MAVRCKLNITHISMVVKPPKSFLVIIIVSTVVSGIYSCPIGCSCQSNSPDTTPSTVAANRNTTPSYRISIPKPLTGRKSKRAGKGRRVDCSNTHRPFMTLDDIQRNSLPLDTVQLILKDNKLSRIPKGAFSSLSLLRKLDLSNNEIKSIEPGAFEGLAKLEKLELSGNLIDHINISMFTGLPKLQKLYLSRNPLQTIPEGTFNYLSALKRINFQSSKLRCDCHLQWIVQWAQDMSVVITKSTTCAGPADLARRKVKSLKKTDLHCQHPLDLEIFEVQPSRSQVVFVGDKLPFHCRVSVAASGDKGDTTHVYWMRANKVVHNNATTGTLVHTTVNPDRTVTHNLVLEKLDVAHNGVWECRVATALGNETRRVNVVVISATATSCPATTVHTNKGVYKWARTVAGIRAEAPCKRSHHGSAHQRASFTCSPGGAWEALRMDACDYVSDVTRRLHKFSTVSLTASITDKDLRKTSKDLLAFLLKQKRLTDAIDVVLLKRCVVEKLVPLVSSRTPQATQNILDIVSFVMDTNRRVLFKAQMEETACSELTRAMEHMSQHMTASVSTVKYSPHIVLAARTEPAKAFPGVVCMVSRPSGTEEREGVCYRRINQTVFMNAVSQAGLEAAIFLPPSLLNTAPVIQGVDVATIGLGITVYDDTSLFPVTVLDHADSLLADRDWTPVSSVISANIGQSVVNLTDPVVIMLQVTNTSGQLMPVYWDFTANNGRGDWSTEGCRLSGQTGPVMVAECHHLTHFAIFSAPFLSRPVGIFHILEPVVYAGSCLLLILMMGVVVTYITCFRYIQIPKKIKHSIINICLSVFLMCLTFTMGVNRVDHTRVCQIVGVNIHYFSLCTIFWVTITSSNMMKKLIKAERPTVPSPEASMMPMPPKPIVRFYLLGWGVPLIICGITAAVDLNHYATLEYCFLLWDVSLGAFFGPVALLVVLNFVFFLRISCIIRSSLPDDVSHTVEETLELHTNEIELTTNHDFDADIASVAHSDTSNGSSLFDREHRPINQLRALVATLFFYIVIWMCGAFAVARPFSYIIPYQDIIFSYLYGFVCILYGLFMFSYYCASRRDTRFALKRIFLRSRQRQQRSGRSGAPQSASTRVSNQITRHQRLAHQSASSVDSSSCNGKSVNLRSSQQLKTGLGKTCNLNPVSSRNTSSVTSGSVVSGLNNGAVFYNTRQNGVAKKYWEKRHYMSSIGKGINNCSASCGSNFGSNFGSNYGSNGVKHISGCTSSDTNTHFSIEIQIQASPGHHAPPNSSVSTPGIQKLYSQCDTATTYSPLNVPRERSDAILQQAIRPGVAECVTDATSQCSVHCASGTTQVPACSTDDCTKPLICTCNNTWGDAAVSSDANNAELRPLDFDGQSQVSQDTPAKRRETCSKNTHTINEFTPSNMPSKCVKSFQSLSSSLNTSPAHYRADSHWSSASSHHPFDYSSDTNVQRARCKEAFLNELQQRIPPPSSVTHRRPLSPAKSDIGQSTGSRYFVAPGSRVISPYRAGSTVDSDHNSEPPACHRHHRHRHHHHQQHRPRGRHKAPGPTALRYHDLKQGRDMHTKPAYTFVDQEYIANAARKIPPKPVPLVSVAAAGNEESPQDAASKFVHFSPPHDQIQQGGMEAMAEDTSSSSEDSGDDAWLSASSKKSKKETSV